MSSIRNQRGIKIQGFVSESFKRLTYNIGREIVRGGSGLLEKKNR